MSVYVSLQKKMKETSFDSVKLREVASNFATGVTVVSTHTPEGDIHGMTASSFLSVSLNPPLVLFSVKKENQLAQWLEIEKSIGISILTEEMQSISNHFAKIELMSNPPQFKLEQGAPILHNTAAWYSTKIHEIISAGDHFLVLCLVLNLDSNPNTKPLIYQKGYKKLG